MHPFSLIATLIAGWMNRHQQVVIEYLQEEVRVLQEQLGQHIRARLFPVLLIKEEAQTQLPRVLTSLGPTALKACARNSYFLASVFTAISLKYAVERAS